MKTLVDPFEIMKPEPPQEEAAIVGDRDEINWHDSTTESHPGVSIESWHRARGWSTED